MGGSRLRDGGVVQPEEDVLGVELPRLGPHPLSHTLSYIIILFPTNVLEFSRFVSYLFLHPLQLSRLSLPSPTFSDFQSEKVGEGREGR